MRIYSVLQFVRIDPIEFIFWISNRIFYFVFHHLCEISKRLPGIVDLLYMCDIAKQATCLSVCTVNTWIVDMFKCCIQLYIFSSSEIFIDYRWCSMHLSYVSKKNTMGETIMTNSDFELINLKLCQIWIDIFSPEFPSNRAQAKQLGISS